MKATSTKYVPVPEHPAVTKISFVVKDVQVGMADPSIEGLQQQTLIGDIGNRTWRNA